MLTGNRNMVDLNTVSEALEIGVITLFAGLVNAVGEYGITGRAAKRGLLRLRTWNPRDYSTDDRCNVDDRPYGGGCGMVMMAPPLCAAIRDARLAMDGEARLIYLSPQGRRLDQAGVVELSQIKRIILVAGRYEGIDERVMMTEVGEEWSIGDYVLSGGELAAMVFIDVLARNLPGALGDDESRQQESFFDGLLDYPHYTRPEYFNRQQVPAVLLSGHHEDIRRWRLQEALGHTWLKRPDLLKNLKLNNEQQLLLSKFQEAYK